MIPVLSATQGLNKSTLILINSLSDRDIYLFEWNCVSVIKIIFKNELNKKQQQHEKI